MDSCLCCNSSSCFTGKLRSNLFLDALAELSKAVCKNSCLAMGMRRRAVPHRTPTHTHTHTHTHPNWKNQTKKHSIAAIVYLASKRESENRGARARVRLQMCGPASFVKVWLACQQSEGGDPRGSLPRCVSKASRVTGMKAPQVYCRNCGRFWGCRMKEGTQQGSRKVRIPTSGSRTLPKLTF